MCSHARLQAMADNNQEKKPSAAAGMSSLDDLWKSTFADFSKSIQPKKTEPEKKNLDSVKELSGSTVPSTSTTSLPSTFVTPLAPSPIPVVSTLPPLSAPLASIPPNHVPQVTVVKKDIPLELPKSSTFNQSKNVDLLLNITESSSSSTLPLLEPSLVAYKAASDQKSTTTTSSLNQMVPKDAIIPTKPITTMAATSDQKNSDLLLTTTTTTLSSTLPILPTITASLTSTTVPMTSKNDNCLRNNNQIMSSNTIM